MEVEIRAIDLGWFVRYATAFLDDCNAKKYYEEDGIQYVPISISGQYRLFEREKLNRLLRLIHAAFYKCYGGWTMGLYFGHDGLFSGKVSFTPNDLHQQALKEA